MISCGSAVEMANLYVNISWKQPDDLFLSESMSFSGVLEAEHDVKDSEKDKKASGNRMSGVDARK